ncbi:Ceramide synthase 1 loh3, variant 2 [Ancistrocladus abbreviatus]
MMGLFDFLKSIDWEAESYPRYEDYIVLPLFAVFFPSLRFFLDRFVFEKIARRLIFGKGNQMKDDDADEKRKRLRKFKESAWKCVYFLSAEILALSVTYNEPWFTNTKYFWVGPGDQIWPNQKMKLKLKGLYMYDAGFYTYSIFALIFWETRRSDFGVSMGHHVATVILIVLSYIFRFARVGSVVLAIHDTSDVFLEVGKMSKYSGAEAVASFAFILFVLSWILLRLTYFPFWVLWSTSKFKQEARLVKMFVQILKMKMSTKTDLDAGSSGCRIFMQRYRPAKLLWDNDMHIEAERKPCFFLMERDSYTGTWRARSANF